MSGDGVEANVSSGGCLSLILGVIVIWALLFGVTLDGKHYGLSGCSCKRGVQVQWGTATAVQR